MLASDPAAQSRLPRPEIAQVRPIGHLPCGTEVHAISLVSGRFAAQIMTYGGTLQGFWVGAQNIVLGYATLDAYLGDQTAYLGATIGRLGNRIRDGRFTLHGVAYQIGVPQDQGLHGGPQGFDKRIWSISQVTETAVTLSLVSADGDQGFPARVAAEVTYALTAEGLEMTHRAVSDAPTPVSMTNHAYLNLGGAVADHVLQLNAAQYLLPDAQGIPVGAPRPVEGTAFDFRTPKRIGEVLDGVDPQIEARGGFDHALCLDGEGMREVGGLSLPGGVSLTLWTDQPVTMFYTGNGLGAGTSKAEAPLRARAGLCLEPQAYVDAINRPDFPFNLTTPDHPHLSRIAWHFGH